MTSGSTQYWAVAGTRAMTDVGRPRRPWRRRSLEATEQVTCWRCEDVTGVASSATIELRLSPRRKGTKVVGGTRIVACALCLARGEITELAKVG